MESISNIQHASPASLLERAGHFWSEGALIGRVRVMPMDLLVGGFHICYVAFNIKKFVDSFYDDDSVVTTTLREVKSLRDRVIERFIYTVQAVSSSMLFMDWGIDKGWFSVKIVARTAFKTVAHSMSVLFWGYKCFGNIRNLVKMPTLIDRAEKAHLYTRAELEPEIYKEWITLFSNFAFVLSSAIQVGCMVMGVAVPLSTVGLLVSVSIGLMVAGFAVDLLSDSSNKMEATKLTFAGASNGKGYTLLK